MTEKIAKLIVLILCPFLAYGFGIALFEQAADAKLPTQTLPFIIGALVFFAFWRLTGRFLEVLCTFEHEITHLIFGLLFLKWPSEFVVTIRNGGHVTLSGSNFIIFLAPYFFPTVSYLLIPFFFFVPPASLPVFYAVLGASFSFHLVSTWGELHWRQTDLHKAGVVFSAVFLPVANLIFYGALLVLIFGDSKAFVRFWKDGVLYSLSLAGY
jgi:hypothetical protein